MMPAWKGVPFGGPGPAILPLTPPPPGSVTTSVLAVSLALGF